MPSPVGIVTGVERQVVADAVSPAVGILRVLYASVVVVTVKVDVGVVYFKMDNVAIDSHITVVRTSKPLYKHYVGRNLLSRQLEIENMAVGSTGQTELPRDRVKALPIIIPSGDVLGKFNDIIEPIALQMYRNIDESRRLAELRDTLLPRLMSGEIDVNEISL